MRLLSFAVLLLATCGAFANPECFCSEEHLVCGEDDVTYDSVCHATCRGKSVVHDGACLGHEVTEGKELTEEQEMEKHLVEEVTENFGEVQEEEQKVEGYTGMFDNQEGEERVVSYTEVHASDDSNSKSKSKDSEDDD